ncbi:MAG: right-handed parallel beta-helix repeat-containing protein, partial [Ruminococcus flavefaciens]|nr:right-handed parallel beta-helix repeat-containing protein [Ruminococcus flavefaciens]
TGGRVLRDGGGIYVDGTGELTLNSGTICDNQAETRTINSTNSESATVTGGVSSDHGGAGVMVYGGKFTMNGGAISDNEAVVAIISTKNNNPHGGGVAVNNGGTFIMTDGLITRNKASFGGGIGVMTSGSTVAISGGTISYNTSIRDGGGGIYFWEEGGGTVENCLITENIAEDGQGGGIVINVDTATTIRNCKITNNHTIANTQTAGATGLGLSGGGIYVCSYTSAGNCTIENCTISGNISINQAGGVLIRGGMSVGALKITGCKITGNTAANHGGGIFYGDSTGDSSATNTVIPTLENSVVTGNSAGGNGGGIYMATYQKLGIKGGVMVVDNGSTNVYLNSVNSNVATAVSRAPKLVIQGLLYGGGVATHIGVSYAKAANITATNNNTKPIFTQGYVSTNTTDTEYFFSDNTNYNVGTGTAEKWLVPKAHANTIPFDWEYELDGNGTWLPVTSPYFTRVYDGKTITGVRASYNGTLINSTAANDFLFVTCSDGSTSFTGLTDVGSVGFVIDGVCNPAVIPSADVPYYCVTIAVVPQDVTVKIDDKTSVYGDTIQTLTTDAAANLGVNTPVKDYGFGVGKYAIRPNGWTNKNYNVTFENATGTAEYGVYEITQRAVTVILNEAQFEYGANAIAVAQGKKDTPDADGKYLEGGWRYDSGSKEFISADISATKNPFKLSSTAEYTAAQSAVSGFTFPTVGTSTPITTSDLNPNYDITFKRDGAPTVPTGLLTIKNAKITVDPDTTHGYATVYGVEDTATKTLAIPSANIKLKGGQSVSSIMYSYVFDSNDEKATAPATTPLLNTGSGDWEWQDGKYNDAALTGTAVSWSPNNATALTKTSAGTYTTYFKISAPNHEDLVQVWTLTINSKAVTVSVRAEKNDKVPPSTADNWVALMGNATYGDELRVAIDLDAITDTSVDKTKLTNYKVYYKGTTAGSAAYPDVTGLTFDTTTLLTTDGTVHQTYGTTTAPTAAGDYTATFVPKNGDYNLGNNQSVSIKIEKKKVSAPTDGSTGGTKTYTALEQNFTVSGFDFNVMKLGTLPTGIADKNSTFASASSTSNTLFATNAGEYKVPFSLKDTDNYEWDSTVTVNASKEYELKLTIKQAPLKVTFKSPAENKTPPEAAKWLWKPDEVSSGSYITYEIDKTSVMPATGTKENVTVYLYWAAKLSTGNVFSTTNIDQDDDGNDRLDVNGFSKGNYAVVAGLKSNDTAGVNKNYVIAVDATTKLPATDGVNRKDFEVGDGTANVKNIKWEVGYTYNGTPSTETYDAATSKIYYKLNNANNGGNAVEYSMSVLATSLPEYLEVYTAYTASGFASGYKDAKYSQSCAVAGVSKYTTVVALKIKDQNDNGDPYTIVFDKNDTTTAGYTYKDDKTCELKIDWVIEKGKLELSGVEWGYTVTGNNTPAEFRTEYKLDNGGQKIPVLDEQNNQVLDENNNPVFETLLATDAQGLKGIVPVITSLGVPATVATAGNYTGHGYGADTINQTKIDELLKTTVSITLVDANFEQPDPVVLEWKVTKATLNITGWQEGGKVKVDGKDYTSPVVTSTDASISDKVEYTYKLNGTNITLKELWEKADQDLAQGGTGRLSGVEVTVIPKNGYQFPSGATTTYTTTLGYTGTPITVTYDKASGEYGKADIKLTLIAAGIGDVTDEVGLYEVKVYAEDGTELGVLGSDGATLSKLPAGKYKIAISTLIPGYNIKAGQDEIAYEVKA